MIVRELAEQPHHWETRTRLEDFFNAWDVPGLQGIDTRALTRHLRARGVMMGLLTTEMGREEALDALRALPGYGSVDLARRVSTEAPYVWKAELAAGASPSAKSKDGRTAADWARRRGMHDVAARLETRMATSSGH